MSWLKATDVVSGEDVSRLGRSLCRHPSLVSQVRRGDFEDHRHE